MTTTIHPAVQRFLAGRIWLRAHTPFPLPLINEQITLGHIQTIPGITSTLTPLKNQKHFCNRCENDNPIRFTTFDCAKCNGPCTYCRHCLKMGRVSTCTDLIYWSGEAPTYSQTHTMAWAGQLTPSQQKASHELLASTKQGKAHLLYAVCGAGKTEILFEPIYQLLSEGKRICLAAPRVDVILELEPRLRAAFPSTVIDALYGGAEPITEAAQLILATTHQLYRFQEAFDVIFVDEADAFPYTADETLQRAVRKAAKPMAPIHAVTATPSADLLQARRKSEAVSVLNRRYHGHALPVPRYEPLWRYSQQIQKGRLPQKLIHWVNTQLEKQQPFLLFFHSIALMKAVEPLFQQLHPQIFAVHAADENRKEIVQKLRDKKVPGLLTTTILERGITIPNVQVAVVGAEQQIFTKGALIQIGGRVGRSVVHPTGDFVLFHHGISYAMDDAKNEIQKLNKGGRIR